MTVLSGEKGINKERDSVYDTETVFIMLFPDAYILIMFLFPSASQDSSKSFKLS